MTESALSDRSAAPSALPRKRLLVVDDDSSISDPVADMLEDDDWDVSGVLTGEQALDLLQRESFDFVLLDIKLPGMDGFEVLRRTRKFSSTPIIALSGLRSLEDRERFMELGGDDYITKPFDRQRLLFRIAAALIRAGRVGQNIPVAPSQPSPHLIFSDEYLTLDLEARRIRAGGKEILLTRIEFAVLKMLAINAGKAVSYDQILEEVWGAEYQGERSYVQDYIGSLRKKLEPESSKPRYIIGIRSFGYRFEPMR